MTSAEMFARLQKAEKDSERSIHLRLEISSHEGLTTLITALQQAQLDIARQLTTTMKESRAWSKSNGSGADVHWEIKPTFKESLVWPEKEEAQETEDD
jgi:ribosome-binding ATPase YchF (GTP1/OBG family)